MSVQLKVLLAGSAVTTAAWCANINYQRRKHTPQGRRRQFTPGSSLNFLSEGLKTGDIILFDRDPAWYYPLGALHSALTKKFTNQNFDHVGLVVLVHGVPYVFEWTPTGIKMRLFDERVMCSTAFQIVVKPISSTVPQDSIKSIEKFVKQKADDPSILVSLRCHLELLRDILSQASRNPSSKVLQDAFSSGNLCIEDRTNGYTIQQWAMPQQLSLAKGKDVSVEFDENGLWFRCQK